MRVLICKLMVVLVLVSITSGVAKTSYRANMEIGLARVNINPPVGVRMGWQSFEGIESDFYVNAMSISDGKTEVIMVS